MVLLSNTCLLQFQYKTAPLLFCRDIIINSCKFLPSKTFFSTWRVQTLSVPSVVHSRSERKSLDLLRSFTDYNLIFSKTKLTLTIHLATLSSANRRTVKLSHIKGASTLSIILFLIVVGSGHLGKGTGVTKHWHSLQQFAIGATDKTSVFISLQWSIFLQTLNYSSRSDWAS